LLLFSLSVFLFSFLFSEEHITLVQILSM
jgi:hypothetical protein